MQAGWIIGTAALCGLVTAAFGLFLYLFLSLKREIRAVATRGDGIRRELASSLEAVQAGLASLEPVVRLIEDHVSTWAAPPPPGAGFNLAKRAQALRMHRRGESSQQIATALALPAKEIELLLKIHRILADEPQ